MAQTTLPSVNEKNGSVQNDFVVEAQQTQQRYSRMRRGFLSLFALLSLLAVYTFLPSLECMHGRGLESFGEAVPVLTKRAAAAVNIPTVDFQVQAPVLTPYSAGNKPGKSACLLNQTLMVHDFAFSYGQPFVGTYTPPKCRFNRVSFNFTVTVAGVQFDRLGTMSLGSTEIWRTSTAEPTRNGIIWTYIKDVSEYLSLFQKKQTIIFDLGNIVDSTYTGIYNTTLIATFWNSEDTVQPADQIIPISAGRGAQNQSSAWTVPSDVAENTVKFPKNVNKAVFTIAATGQIAEEFWYTNVLQSDVNTFGPGSFYGASPYREVQLYIDDLLAGIILPFPIIFTGGIVPGLWRPVVGIDAFDLREDEIDITPWLPLLCNGNKHTFQIRIRGINDNGKGKGELVDAPSYWIVTGKIFLWLDPAGSQTTGSSITYSAPGANIHLTQSVGQDVNGTNETLAYSVDVKRKLSVSSTITTANGTSSARWTQSLSYSNLGNITAYGFDQLNNQTSNGVDVSSSGYKRQISYPISVYETVAYPGGYLSLYAEVQRGQSIQIEGVPTFPSGLQNFDQLPAKQGTYPTYQGSTLETTQNGTAYYQVINNGANAISYGNTTQEMSLSGNSYGNATNANGFPYASTSDELFTRLVRASNGSVVYDSSSLIGRSSPAAVGVPLAGVSDAQYFAPATLRMLTGRNPVQ